MPARPLQGRRTCGYHSTVKSKTAPATLHPPRRPHVRALLAIALVTGLGGLAPPASAQNNLNATSLPTLGDTAREDLSPVLERRLGEEIMRDIKRDHDFLDDDPILEYL